MYLYKNISCTGVLQTWLVSLQTEYADDPLTWDYMARRELGLGSLKSTEPTTKQMKVSEMTQREERCCAVFEEAVTAVPTGEIFCLHVNVCFSWYFSILYTVKALKELLAGSTIPWRMQAAFRCSSRSIFMCYSGYFQMHLWSWKNCLTKWILLLTCNINVT